MTKRRRTDRTFFFPPEISSWTQFLFSLFSYVSCLNIKWKWCHRLECLRNKSIRGQEDLQMYVAFDPENVNIESLPLFLVISPSLIVSGKALVTQTGNGKSWCLWIKRILYGKLLYFWLTCGFMIVWRTCHCLVNVFSTASVSPPLLFSLSLLAKQHDSRHNSIDIWEVQCVTHVTQKDIHKWHSVNALLVQHTLYDTIELLLGCPFLFFYSLSLQQHNSWQQRKRQTQGETETQTEICLRKDEAWHRLSVSVSQVPSCRLLFLSILFVVFFLSDGILTAFKSGYCLVVSQLLYLFFFFILAHSFLWFCSSFLSWKLFYIHLLPESASLSLSLFFPLSQVAPHTVTSRLLLLRRCSHCTLHF